MPHDALLAAALAEAERSATAGGLPIGAAIADPSGAVVVSAHNRMPFPSGHVASHAELNAIIDLGASGLAGHTLLTTMPPCWMCAGACRHFGLARLVVVRQPYDSGAAAALAADPAVDVAVERIACPSAVELFETWRAAHPDCWPNPRLTSW